ncbi:HNH endonuclease [Neobacillus niacini]|uniref:HNH endonuclease n=1 Tax=Neobacillus niacini TaxID=86668 RepID=UPI002041E9B2|nr:HNH endonuclease signature motif containing protein [Neobacillus niacini]MCM3692454.1 HNH endonuclease [Neobacillus niacini]
MGNSKSNLDSIFSIRSYPNYYKFEYYECVICQRVFPSPSRYSKRLYTCCKYCENVRNGLLKVTGFFRLCKVCDKPIWVSSCHAKTKFYCSQVCKSIGQTFFDSLISEDLKTGGKKYYGPNWLHQRKRARKRDSYTCQNPSCRITEKEYGQELSVHHKVPFVYFNDYSEANKLDNLVSLCEPCHRKAHVGKQHPLKFNTEKIVFENTLERVGMRQLETAKKVVYLLLNTDKSLRVISEETGLSYQRVRSIYLGERWTQLYTKSPKEIRPREMSIFKDPISSREKIKEAVYLLLNTDLTIKEIMNQTGVSKSNLYSIYNGKTNQNLYDIAPRLVRPRSKSLKS